MPRDTRALSYFPIQIPIYTLSGGVGRQIPSKRLSSECDKLTNFFCTTQSSIDKRNGTEWVGNLGTLSTDSSELDQLYYSWTEVDANTSILIIIDTGLPVNWLEYPNEPDSQADFFVTPLGAYRAYKITASEDIGSTTVVSIPTTVEGWSTMDWRTYNYLMWNPNSIPARDRLRTVNVGSATLILNKDVTAGFTSIEGRLSRDPAGLMWTHSGEGDDFLKKLDGTSYPAREGYCDFEGADITYLTALAVDRKHDSELWVESQDYTWGSQAIDTTDPVVDPANHDADPTGYPFGSFLGPEWIETVVSHEGGILEIDFNSSVKTWEPNEFESGAHLTNTELGCQLTLKGVNSDNNTTNTKNYLWLKESGGSDATSGSEFYFTENGEPDLNGQVSGPDRADTIVVNTLAPVGGTASATFDFGAEDPTPSDQTHPQGSTWSWSRSWRRYPLYLTVYPNSNTNYPPGRNHGQHLGGDAGLPAFEEAGYLKDWGYSTLKLWPEHCIVDNSIPENREKLAYIELTDNSEDPKTIRYYLLGDVSTTGGGSGAQGWREWERSVVTDEDSEFYLQEEWFCPLSQAEMDELGVDNIYAVDFWNYKWNNINSLRNAIMNGDHSGKFANVAQFGTTLHIVQPNGGESGNTEIKFNLNDHLLDNGLEGDDFGAHAIVKCQGVARAAEGETLTFTGGVDFQEAAYSSEQRASGWADADALARVINIHQGDELLAVPNVFSLENRDLYAGRVIISQKFPGAYTNTNVWVNDHEERVMNGNTYEYTRDWNLNLFCSTSIPSSFIQGTNAGGSINNEITQTWGTASGGVVDPVTGEGGVQNWWDDFNIPYLGWYLYEGSNPLRFGIWEVRDYLPTDELPGPTNVLLSRDEDRKGSQLPPHKDKVRWQRVKSEDSDLVDLPGGDGVFTYLNVATSRFIPVEDYIYPNSKYLHLGQSFKQLSDMKFPPDGNDLVAFNGGEVTEKVLETLYDTDSDSNTYGRDGKGKIMYLSQASLQNTPGWYRIIRKDKSPYLTKIRTQGKRTTLDKYRMPQVIFSSLEETELIYKAEPVEWDQRQSGDEENNRGPGLFFNSADGKPMESKISAMAFYRDRLFLANEDTVVASRSGNWDNFFLENPDNIVDSDPLDLMISSNNYTPITYLIPFRDFLFVGTSGNTQYELTGSNNIISPLTAEFAPTAYYPMMPDVPPMGMNNNLFFYSKGQLFIYFGQRDLATEQAFEVSKHVPNYLPDNLEASAASSFGSMLFGLNRGYVKADLTWVPSTIYCYRNQIAGEKVVQNAFFDWTFGGGLSSGYAVGEYVEDIKSWDKYLYLIQSDKTVRQTVDEDGNFVDISRTDIWLSRLKLDNHDVNIPRLDNMKVISGDDISLVEYDGAANSTSFTFSDDFDVAPFYDTLITGNGDFIKIDSSSTNRYVADGKYDIYVTDPDNPSGDPILFKDTVKYIGTRFISSVVLSPIYLRDDSNNITPGTLNLRSGLIQTYNSKEFDVEVDVNNRSKKTLNFVHDIADDRWEDDYIGSSTLTGQNTEHQVRFPILGFSQDVKITVSSDNPHPLNIASLQFMGKFKPITRYHNS